jgi:hypothetical protein
MLQQNWALIELLDHGVNLVFVHDGGGIFDRIPFASQADAEAALLRNGFSLFADDREAQTFIRPPDSPYFDDPTAPNVGVYSSGRFWTTGRVG